MASAYRTLRLRASVDGAVNKLSIRRVSRIIAKLLIHRPDLYRELIQSIFMFDWDHGDEIVAAFTHLLSLLVSANPVFLIPTFKLIIKNVASIGKVICFFHFTSYKYVCISKCIFNSRARHLVFQDQPAVGRRN